MSATVDDLKHLKRLIEQGASWDEEQEAIKNTEINKWRFLTLLGAMFSICLVGALIGLTPLKTQELVIVEHDRSTGRTEVMYDADTQTLSEKEIVVRYNLHKFVQAYEAYSYYDHDDRYEIVAAMSSKDVYDAYHKQNTKKNPTSNFNRLGKEASFEIDVKSINELAETPGTYIVRYSKTLHSIKSGVKPQTVHYIGTYAVRFVKRKVHDSDIYLNPLGFQVYSKKDVKESI